MPIVTVDISKCLLPPLFDDDLFRYPMKICRGISPFQQRLAFRSLPVARYQGRYRVLRGPLRPRQGNLAKPRYAFKFKTPAARASKNIGTE